MTDCTQKRSGEVRGHFVPVGLVDRIMKALMAEGDVVVDDDGPLIVVSPDDLRRIIARAMR